MHLSQLKPAIDEVPPDEALSIIRRLRESRRTPKKRITKKKTQGATARKKTVPASMLKQIGQDPEKLKAVIAQLEGMMKDGT